MVRAPPARAACQRSGPRRGASDRRPTRTERQRRQRVELRHRGDWSTRATRAATARRWCGRRYQLRRRQRQHWIRRGASAGQAGSGAGAGDAPAGRVPAPQLEAPRRLYQIREGAVISGVCKGLAAYLNIDVSIIRILFVVLVILTGGVWILVYIVMMFVIPYAQTSEQHAAAHGWPFNAEELVARAKAHYAQFRENGTSGSARQ